MKRRPWLSCKHVHSVHPSSKLDHHYPGPQKTMAWVSKVTFCLQHSQDSYCCSCLPVKTCSPRSLPVSPLTSDSGYGLGPEGYCILLSWIARYTRVTRSIVLTGQGTTWRTVPGSQCQRCMTQLRSGLSMPINLVSRVHWQEKGGGQGMVSRSCSYLLKGDSVL